MALSFRSLSACLNRSLACCLMFGCIITVEAGTRDNNADDQSNRQVESDSQDVQQSLHGPISIEESIRLRRDLDEYSKQVDPAHVQIEERRRVMHQRVQSRFAETDRDNDGTISRDEAADMMPQVARHFNQVDLNNDGLISLDELETLQARIISQRPSAIKIESPEPSDVSKKKSKDAMLTNRKRAL